MGLNFHPQKHHIKISFFDFRKQILELLKR